MRAFDQPLWSPKVSEKFSAFAPTAARAGVFGHLCRTQLIPSSEIHVAPLAPGNDRGSGAGGGGGLKAFREGRRKVKRDFSQLSQIWVWSLLEYLRIPKACT